jgi:hypothetical protein
MTMRAEIEDPSEDQQMRPAEQPKQTAAALGFCLLLRSLWRLLSIDKGRPVGAAFVNRGPRATEEVVVQ